MINGKYSLALVAACLVMISSCGKPTKEDLSKKELRTCEDGILSYQYAKDFVKRNLKAPSTAKFPSFREVNHAYLGNCTHIIIGYVDAQNSFGAIIRNRFDVTVTYVRSEKTYYLDSIVIE